MLLEYEEKEIHNQIMEIFKAHDLTIGEATNILDKFKLSDVKIK